MLIAIHHRPESYSIKWIEYCQENNISYKLVNCYDNDIIQQLNDCDGLMWHWPHWDFKASLFARQLTISLETIGKKVFPDTKTAWHYDDKVGQKYLLEGIKASLIPSTVFFNKGEAIKWTITADFPVVFKLRGGASSMNVKLLNTKTEAKRYIRKAFKNGFPVVNRMNVFEDRIMEFRKHPGVNTFKGILKGILRLFIPTELERVSGHEKGYIYFQKFIPNNSFDTRIFVIGNRAFGARRFVRKNDFRASGSHNADCNPSNIDLKCVKLAFETTAKLQSQCVAFDFIFQDGEPLITEISYASSIEVYRDFPGYWDNNLKWIDQKFIEEYFMIEDFVNSIAEDKYYQQSEKSTKKVHYQ
jgi:glutathione synthase/RimK-type ligase-like ATP-grasp enzyme